MSFHRVSLIKVLILLPLLGLVGCNKPVQEVLTAEEMFQKALEYESKADSDNAEKTYNDIQAIHPFGQYAQQSLLNLIVLHYGLDEYEAAAADSEKFISDYPNHAEIDYALYMRARSLLHSKPSLVGRFLGEESFRRSQDSLLESFDAFNELVVRFPDSKYSSNARTRMRHLINEIARIELDAAMYYLRRGAYSASARRSSNLLANYPDSTSGEIALAVLVASLKEVGSQVATKDALASLSTSFPDSLLIQPAQNGAVALIEVLGIKKQGDLFTNLIEPDNR